MYIFRTFKILVNKKNHYWFKIYNNKKMNWSDFYFLVPSAPAYIYPFPCRVFVLPIIGTFISLTMLSLTQKHWLYKQETTTIKNGWTWCIISMLTFKLYIYEQKGNFNIKLLGVRFGPIPKDSGQKLYLAENP